MPTPNIVGHTAAEATIVVSRALVEHGPKEVDKQVARLVKAQKGINEAEKASLKALEALNARTAEVEADHQDRIAHVVMREQACATRDEKLDTKENRINQSNDRLVEARAVIAEQQASVQAAEQRIVEADQRIVNATATLGERYESVDKREAAVEKATSQVKAREERVVEFIRDVGNMRAKI